MYWYICSIVNFYLSLIWFTSGSCELIIPARVARTTGSAPAGVAHCSSCTRWRGSPLTAAYFLFISALNAWVAFLVLHFCPFHKVNGSEDIKYFLLKQPFTHSSPSYFIFYWLPTYTIEQLLDLFLVLINSFLRECIWNVDVLFWYFVILLFSLEISKYI